MSNRTPLPVCAQCPWRLSNQGSRHRYGFYTKKNLLRLWGQIRHGGGQQSCHLTDPSHPDHVESGCPKNAKAHECPGSVIVVLRELQKMVGDDNTVSPESVDAYLKRRGRKGLSKNGIAYWLISRHQFGGKPVIGGPRLPEVDMADAAVGLPGFLEGS